MKLDTNRDGFEIDCCRHAHISNCSVNSPFDDAIVLKSSYALGFGRVTEDVNSATFINVRASHGEGIPSFVLKMFQISEQLIAVPLQIKRLLMRLM